MFMTPLSASTIDAYNAAGGSASANNDPQAAQDRFLKLMVTQLENQDPLNPMDNAELTSQMAQINTVTGIQTLNATLKGMSEQFVSMQAMQSTSLIGKQAVVSGNTLGFADDGVGSGLVLLSEGADSVKVTVKGVAGQVLGTVDLGALPQGQHRFEWDSEGLDRNLIAGFEVSASKGDDPVTATPLSSLRIESVGLVEGAIRLRTEGGQAFAYQDVLAFQ